MNSASMRPSGVSALLLAPICLAAVSLASASPRTGTEDTITPWQVATMKTVRSAQISPDGRHVAYILSVPREPKLDKDGGARSQLHVLDFASGESRAFVTAKSGVSGVSWTPDSRSIGFLAKRDGDDHRALYLIAVHGGEAQRVVSLDDRSIGSYEFSPDGTRVALVATVPVSKSREAEKKNGFKQEIYEEDWRAGEAWIATLPSASDAEQEPTALVVSGHVSGLSWAPDGGRLALRVAPTSLVDDSYVRQRILIIDPVTNTEVTRIASKGKLGAFEWNTDGSGLALIASIDEWDGSAARLHYAPVSNVASSPATPLLGERERDEHAIVSFSGSNLIVRGSEGAWSTLDSYRLEGGQAVDRQALLPLEGPAWTQVSLSKDGQRAALVGSTPGHPSELFTFERSAAAARRRTDSNPWLADLRLAQQEVVRFAARDGLEIEGILIHPLTSAGNETPAPLIVSVHGGPEAHISNGWLTGYSYLGQVAAARGYASFYPNYRGSTGRGLAYLQQSQGDAAGKEFDDIVDGVDYLIERGIVDRDKVGVTGGSYGGYATAWCSTYYSDRFAAGVMFVGISDKVSKVGTTDIADEEYYAHAHERVWDNWQFFLERSPIYYADRGKTPLLIMHGKADPRVDPGQSREMYRHLKQRGKAPVRLVLYPGEGHGNRMAASRFDYNLRSMRWFDHYLQGTGGAPPEYALDYDAHIPGEEPEAPEEAQGM